MRSHKAWRCWDLVRPLGHNRNVCDLRRPCGQHGTVGGIENGIHQNRNRDDVKMKNDAMQQVEVKHNKTRQRLAVLIWDGEKYLEEAKVDTVPGGRVAATPGEAAESEYVDDMVSTNTQELDF